MLTESLFQSVSLLLLSTATTTQTQASWSVCGLGIVLLDLKSIFVFIIISMSIDPWSIFEIPGSRDGGRVAGFGRAAVVWANGVVWFFTGDTVVGSGRFVIIPVIGDAIKIDGDVVAGKTLGIKIHSAGVSVLSSENEKENYEKRKEWDAINFAFPWKLTRSTGQFESALNRSAWIICFHSICWLFFGSRRQDAKKRVRVFGASRHIVEETLHWNRNRRGSMHVWLLFGATATE